MIYIATDIAFDLFMAQDESYEQLIDIVHGDFPEDCDPCIVNGVFVEPDDAQYALDAYVESWGKAWVDTGFRLGYDPLVTSDEWIQSEWIQREWIQLNSPENLDRTETGVSVVDVAWQKTWDECPTVEFTDQFLP